APLDRVAAVNMHARTVLHSVGGTFRAVSIRNRNDHVADHGDQVAFAVLGDRLVLDRHFAIEVRFNEGLLVDLRCATYVEGAHRQLRAGLADRLRRNDADRLAMVDRRAARKVAAVALAADAVDELASQSRSYLHLLDTGLMDGFHVAFLHQGAALDDHLVGRGITHVLARGAAENAGAQRGHHGAGVDNGAHLDAELGAAIIGIDDAVLSHVDKASRQVAGVGGFQGGIGQTLAGAVGRVEILEHREAFLEVGNDRRLDDFARRLGHQPAHAGELTHLRGRASRTRMRHHVDRVDVGFRALGVLLGRGDFLHHLLGDFLGRLRPGVDDLVVLFAVSDQTVIVLLLEILRQRAGGLDDLPLAVRHHHVVLAEGNPGLERIVKTERHDAIAEYHRLLLTAVAIDLIDHAGDFALGHQLVDDVERNLRAAWQDVAEHYATCGGLDPALDRIAGLVRALPTILDLAVQVDDPRVQRMLDL